MTCVSTLNYQSLCDYVIRDYFTDRYSEVKYYELDKGDDNEATRLANYVLSPVLFLGVP